MTPTIKFSHNWNNKLFGIAFTTIRLRNDDKYKVGQLYDIAYKEDIIGTGTIEEIINFKLADLNNFMAFVDTGYGKDAATAIIQNMYKKANLNWEMQQLSFILIKMPDTKTRYVIPTRLKLTDKKAELFPDPEVWRHHSTGEVLMFKDDPGFSLEHIANMA